jgi:hypothetical protein
MAEMNHTHLTKQVAFAREHYIKRLMPDTCQLFPTKGTAITIADAGILQQTPATAKTWRTLTSIPCRVDMSRAFRPDSLPSQTVVIDEYNLQLPFDTNVAENDLVHIGTKVFEIRKLKKISEWDYTVEALIMDVSTDIDI